MAKFNPHNMMKLLTEEFSGMRTTDISQDDVETKDKMIGKYDVLISLSLPLSQQK